jgi:hypothetical protein
MYVQYDAESPPGRRHPWTFSEAKPEEKYIDFKAHPEQIRVALPDFTPWSHYPAIQTFYDLLAWLNGTDSIFESNDSGLRPPRRDNETPEPIRVAFDPDPVVMHGRLAIIFRNLAWNASPPHVEQLKTAIHDGLIKNVPNIPAVVNVGERENFFAEIQKEGRAVTLRYWAWGDDEAVAMTQLNSTFVALDGCLRWISNGLKTADNRENSTQ